MTEGLKWTVNEVPKSDDKHLELMSEENVKKANEFHRSFPQYSVTPLQNLSSLAKYLGVKNIFCKDESYRFGLNAFKVLGGSYAMGRYIAKELGRDISELPYNVLSSDKLREELNNLRELIMLNLNNISKIEFSFYLSNLLSENDLSKIKVLKTNNTIP